MRFHYSGYMQQTFPDRVSGILLSHGIHDAACVTAASARFTARAAERLAGGAEGTFAEVQAWRRAYTAMGLKPTQYRCAAEALLRRFRKEGLLPSIHPLIDLCNAASLAFAVPVAVFDLERVDGDLIVRQATGEETYLTFSGALETPPAGEVIFADDAGNAHARRWANRQSGLSAVSSRTSRALIVAEALHDTAAADMARLLDELASGLLDAFDVRPDTALLQSPGSIYDSAPR